MLTVRERQSDYSSQGMSPVLGEGQGVRESCSGHLMSHGSVGAIPVSRANLEVGKEVSEWVVRDNERKPDWRWKKETKQIQTHSFSKGSWSPQR